MMERMEESLAQLVEDITVNVGYPIYFENLDILVTHQFYFDICRLVFPQLNIKIIKIAEDQTLQQLNKIQSLLKLLTQQLQIQFSSFSPSEILKGNFFHIHPLLKLLKQFSDHRPEQIQHQSMKNLRRVKTFPLLSQVDKNSIFPKSAREKFATLQNQNQLNDPNFFNQSPFEVKQQIAQNEGEREEKKEQKFEQSPSKKERKKTKIIKNKNNKSTSNLQKTCNNFNKKYQVYLQKLMKPCKSSQKRENLGIRPKSAKAKGWMKDIQQIDDFFASFASKLECEKQRYLRKMQKIIRAKQNERMWERNKHMRESLKKTEMKYQKQLSKLSHAHQNRRQLLKEQGAQTRQQLSLIKKQVQKNAREERRQLKERKKKELKQIKNYIEQLNQKILMKFQEGGYYQKLVLGLYKKY